MQIVFIRYSKNWGGEIMEELLKFLEEHGHADFVPILDGNWYRIDANTTFAGTEFHDPHFISACIKDWRAGEEYLFKTTKNYSEDEKNLNAKRLEETRKANEEKQKEDEARASKIAEEKWKQAGTNNSPYLNKKGFGEGSPTPYGLRTCLNSWGDYDLLVPYKDTDGKLWGVQKIQGDGAKFFQPGAKIKGCFFSLGEITPQTQKIYIAEGVATAISIYLATNNTTICAFNANNLTNVALEFRKKYPSLPIIICGDDDRFTMVQGEYKNVGKEAAEKAAAIISGVAVFPHFVDATGRGTDFNDLHMAEGIDAVKDILVGIAAPDPQEIIPTQKTGFHKIIETKTKTQYVPMYEDLRRFFEKMHPYKILEGSNICYVWTGKYYKEYPRPFLEGFAQTHFFPIADNKKCAEFKGLVLRTNFTDSEWFDKSSENKINFQNGVLNIKTNDFVPHSPDMGFKYVLKYNYDAKAECPVFDKFIKDVTCNDESLEANLLEFMGYAISNDDCWIQKALVLEGHGSNGKSTLMYLLRELAGEANCSAYTLADLKEEKYRHGINGKLFNMTEEIPKSSLAESSVFKALVGGGVVAARQLYANPYTFRNKAKIMFACNEMPQTQDTSHGLLRRLVIIPFKAVFDEKFGNIDADIEKKLLKELPGIFNKVLKYYKECKKRRKLSSSDARDKAIHNYQREIDHTLDWIETNIQTHPMGNGLDEKFQAISTLYADYKLDVENAGFRPIDKFKFGKKLSRTIQDYDKRISRRRVDGKIERVLIATTRESGENF